MQCSECGYISFKKEKACRSCGFKFIKTAQSSQSLTGKETFSIFAGSAKEQSEDSPVVENVGFLDEQEPAPFIDPETGDFNLDLPDTSEETTNEPHVSSENTGYQSMEFNMYEDIELEEIEGLGLEPLHATETLRESETDTTVDSVEEIKIDEPKEAASLKPALEIGEPRSKKVALDLDNNKIVLELDDNQSTLAAPSVATTPLDEIKLNLEIDDSDGLLTKQNQDIPDIEIEDLGLELEIDDSDGPLTKLNQDIPDIEIEDLGLELEKSDDPEPDKP